MRTKICTTLLKAPDLRLPKEAMAVISLLEKDLSGAYRVKINPFVTDKIKEIAKALPGKITEALAPCQDREWLKGAVYSLLQHYYVADLPTQVQTMIAQDWVRALASFPQWAIQLARDEWILKEERKPTPAGIIKLIKKQLSKYYALLIQCDIIIRTEPCQNRTETPLTDEERASSMERVLKMKEDAVRALKCETGD